MKKFLIIALLFSLPINGRTFSRRVTYKQQQISKQNKSRTDKVKLSKEETLKKLSDIIFDKDQMQNFFTTLSNQFASQSKCEIPEDLKKRMIDSMNEKFNAPETVKSFSKAWEKHFTDKELEDLVTFYESPTGKKSIKKMPELAVEGAQIGIKIAQEIADEFKAEFDKLLNDKSLKNNENLVK